MMMVRWLGRLSLVAVMLILVLSTGYTQPTSSTGQQNRLDAVRARQSQRVTHAQRLEAAAAVKALRAKGIQSGTPEISFAPMAMPMPGMTPNFFGPEPNWAYSPAPTVNPTTGAITGGMRKFIDSLPGLNFANRNNLGQYIPVAIPDITTYPGTDYYEIELGQYTERMHTDLQPTTIRGYRQTNTTDANVSKFHYLGPLILARKDRPVRVKFTNALPTGAGGKLFIPVDTTVMGAGMGPKMHAVTPGYPMNYTENRGTIHLHGGNTPWISDGTAHQWITPAGELTDYPKGVSVRNVPDMPDPGDGSMTFYYANEQSARLMFYHDHAYGITRLNVYAGEAAGYLLSDATESRLIANGVLPDVGTPLIIQDKAFIDPATLLTTDPTWPFPVSNTLNNLWMPHVYMPNQNPNLLSGINPLGRWDYGPWINPPWPVLFPPTNGPVYTPNVPNISMGMESFFDTPLVNGTAYPYTVVQPKTYRFRILNASNDRFWNLLLVQADPAAPTEIQTLPFDGNTVWPANWPTPDLREGGVPDPALMGPKMIQIGTEGGFLPAPVVHDNVPIGWDMDPKSATVGNILEHTLLLGPAERADVLIDFSAYAGQTLILYNDAPAALPAGDPRYDYFTGNSDLRAVGGANSTLPGYGPNTRTIMQIRVAAAPVAPAYNLAALNNEFATTTLPDGTVKKGVFAESQEPILVPQTPYNSAYNGNFPAAYARVFDTSLTFTPLNGAGTVTIPFKSKTIVELFENTYGRMSGFLGVQIPFNPNGPEPVIQLAYMDPATEIVDDSVTIGPVTAGDGTQLWKITHNGVDTHPIHFHLFNVQVVNRMDAVGVVKPPEPNELGWKETVRMNPLEDVIVALRPVASKPPFGQPDSIRPLDPTMPIGSTDGFRPIDPTTGLPLATPTTNQEYNFGWEYMWHCHILSHEEMDMMRPIKFNVGRSLATMPMLSVSGSPGVSANLTWTDPTPFDYATMLPKSTMGNPASEIGFRIERATGGTGGTFTIIGYALANRTSFVDTTAAAGTTYQYRVIAFNAAGDTASNIVLFNVLPPAAPTNLQAVLRTTPAIDLSWMDNATDETGFVVERSVNGGAFAELATVAALVNTGTVTYSDTAVTVGNTYAYRVKAVKDTLSSTYSNPITINIPVPPAAPTNLQAVLRTTPAIDLTWMDNATDETGFAVERSVNSNAFAPLVTVPARTNTGTVTYSDTTVTAGNTYAYRVKAIKDTLSSTYSNTASITIATAPAAPTNLQAVLSTTPAIALTWFDNATDETGFVVERSVNGAAFAQLATLGPRTTTGTVTYNDTAVTVGNTYAYRVKAVKGTLSSAYSNTASVSITTAPAAPTNLQATFLTNPAVRLQWRDNATDETGFVVERRVNGGAFAQLATLGPRTTTGTVTYNDVTVVAGTTYGYRVKTVKGTVASTYSNTVSITIPTPPAAPSSVTVTSARFGTLAIVTIRWRDNANNETGYYIQRATNASFTTGVITYANGVNTRQLQELTARRVAYYYRVRAVNAQTASAWINATPFPITTP